MFLASWFTEHEYLGDSAMNERDPQPHRKPIRSRPALERLEERTLLNATNGLVEGGLHNLNLNNNYNFATNGIVSPLATNNVLASGEHAIDPSGRVSSGTAAEASSAALPAQDQQNAQFRIFGVNSQGADAQRINQVTANILRDAYGFGSGSQPNAPWRPNAYNLGLANHQFNYSTQSDNGFSSVAPWSHQWSSPVAQSQRSQPNNPDSPPDEDQLHYLKKDELGEQTSDQFVAHRSLREQEQSQQDRVDNDVGDKSDDLQALIEQQTSEKKPPIETIEKADGTLPDSLWLSALAPAPMAALVAGLPGMAAEAEGGEAGAEGGGAVEAAPE